MASQDRTERIAKAQTWCDQYQAFQVFTRYPGPLRPMWSLKDIADWLDESRTRPRTSPQTVASWCTATLPNGERALPGAVNYGANIGWRIPREDLMVFFAEGFLTQIEGASA